MEDEKDFSIFERKIVHIIYGPVCSNGERRIRTNKEIHQLLDAGNIASFVKSSEQDGWGKN